MSNVYFTDMRTKARGIPVTEKLKRLMKAAGFDKIDLKGKYVAIKMHFGELGNLSFLRPNYAKAVVDFVKKHYSLAIGDRTAEDIKFELASATQRNDGFYDVKGRDIVSGLPKNIKISSTEVKDAISVGLKEISAAIKSTLEDTPPELAADIIENGIILTGGGALIKNIDSFLENEIGITVHSSENPMDCAVIGTGKALENSKVLARSRFAVRKKK